MKRLKREALNPVLKDSFDQDMKKNEPQHQEMQGPPEHPEHHDPHSHMPTPLPLEHEDHESKPVEPVEDDGMGFDDKPLEEALVDDICSLQVLYQQVKFFHWIATGDSYITNHRFFDEIAHAILQQIDLLAERLVYLELTPVADSEEIVKRSYVEFTQTDNNFKIDGAISIIDEDLSKVIDNFKNNALKSGDSKNIGTEKMLQDFVYDLEVLQHHVRSFKG